MVSVGAPQRRRAETEERSQQTVRRHAQLSRDQGHSRRVERASGMILPDTQSTGRRLNLLSEEEVSMTSDVSARRERDKRPAAAEIQLFLFKPSTTRNHHANISRSLKLPDWRVHLRKKYFVP